MDSTLNDRRAALKGFVAQNGWGDADLHPLGQDASTRSYIRLKRGTETAILMDAPLIEPPHCLPEDTEADRLEKGWNASTRLASSRVDAFVLIAHFLRSRGLSAPEIYAHDSVNGFAILEDFGTSLEFARLIERGEADETALYKAAAETLAKVHRTPAPKVLELGNERWPILDFDDVALRANSDLFADWLHRHDERARMSDADRAQWESVQANLIEQAMTFPREFQLRDYHAENLLWLPARTGTARVGLLDFQDAVNGWDAWDLAMLTQDARRIVSDDAAEAAITTYLDLTGKSREAFDERLAIIGTLNALRIVGVFARLVTRDGKPRYLDFMPRQQMLLAKNLQHPATRDVAHFVRDVAPFIFEVNA